VRAAVGNVAKCGRPSLEDPLEVFEGLCCSQIDTESHCTPPGRRFPPLEQTGRLKPLRHWNLLPFHQVVT
jgi:hypothetical protein